MEAAQRATAGMALVALAYTSFIYLALQGPLTLFGIAVPLIALGLWLATLGLATLRTGHGYAPLAGGLALAALSAVVALLADLGAADLFKVPHAVAAVGFVQAAWFAMLWWLGPTGSGRRAAAGLEVSAWVLLVAAALYFVLVVANGFYEAAPLEGLYVAGAWLLAKNVSKAESDLEARAERGAHREAEGLKAPLPKVEPKERIR